MAACLPYRPFRCVECGKRQWLLEGPSVIGLPRFLARLLTALCLLLSGLLAVAAAVLAAGSS